MSSFVSKYLIFLNAFVMLVVFGPSPAFMAVCLAIMFKFDSVDMSLSFCGVLDDGMYCMCLPILSMIIVFLFPPAA